MLIVKYRWWNQGGIHTATVGAVLVHNGFDYKVYMGVGLGISEHIDSEYISAYGAKVEPEIAKVLFPDYADKLD